MRNLLGNQMSALPISQTSGSRIAPRLGIGLLALVSIAATSAYAKTPQQIFAQDAPSIVVVTAYDASEPPRVSWRLFGLSQASAVAA